jgi:hypothetical protein
VTTTIITIISTLLAFLKALTELAQNKQLMDAGAAEAILNALEAQNDAIAKAQAARNAVANNNERDPDSILRDDDGFKRPD